MTDKMIKIEPAKNVTFGIETAELTRLLDKYSDAIEKETEKRVEKRVKAISKNIEDMKAIAQLEIEASKEAYIAAYKAEAEEPIKTLETEIECLEKSLKAVEDKRDSLKEELKEDRQEQRVTDLLDMLDTYTGDYRFNPLGGWRHKKDRQQIKDVLQLLTRLKDENII